MCVLVNLIIISFLNWHITKKVPKFYQTFQDCFRSRTIGQASIEPCDVELHDCLLLCLTFCSSGLRLIFEVLCGVQASSQEHIDGVVVQLSFLPLLLGVDSEFHSRYCTGKSEVAQQQKKNSKIFALRPENSGYTCHRVPYTRTAHVYHSSQEHLFLSLQVLPDAGLDGSC